MSTCDDCGAEYKIHALIPRDAWLAIGPAYALCVTCIDKRLVERGITATCDVAFHGHGLRTNAMSPLWRYREVCGTEPHPALS